MTHPDHALLSAKYRHFLLFLLFLLFVVVLVVLVICCRCCSCSCFLLLWFVVVACCYVYFFKFLFNYKYVLDNEDDGTKSTLKKVRCSILFTVFVHDEENENHDMTYGKKALKNKC